MTEANAVEMAPAGALAFEVLDTPGALRKVRGVWTALAAHPNADFDRYVLEAERGVMAPRAYVARRGDRPVGLMAGRIEPVRWPLRAGYARLAAPRLQTLSFYAGCLAGCEAGDVAAAFADAADAALREGVCEAVRLFDVPVAGALVAAVRQVPWHRRGACADAMPHWRIALPDSSDAFFRRMKEKHRRPLRKLCRLMDGPNDLGLSWRHFQRVEEVEAFCRDAERVSARSHLRALSIGFADGDAPRTVMAHFAGRGLWHGLVLYAGGAPVAFWAGTCYGGVFHTEYTGRDPGAPAMNPGPGTLLLAKLAAHVCDTGLARELDFGGGDFAYKRRFGTSSVLEYPMVALFAPRLRPMAFHAAETVLCTGGRALRGGLDALGVRETVADWRRRRVIRAAGARGRT